MNLQMDKPIVSIIIATFNSEKTLRNALDSIIAQQFQNWECIVVDGASKDNTVRIIEEYEHLDSRFRHISEKDHGVYDAFNKGWKLAKGEWVHYLGSDDRLTKESFIGLLDKDNSPYDVICGNCYMVHVDGKIEINVSKGFKGCHQAKLTRRSALERVNGYDESYRIIADAELYRRLFSLGSKTRYVDTNVAYFAMDGMSQKMSTLCERTKELHRMYKKYTPNPCVKSACFFCHSLLSICKRNFLKLF